MSWAPNLSTFGGLRNVVPPSGVYDPIGIHDTSGLYRQGGGYVNPMDPRGSILNPYPQAAPQINFHFNGDGSGTGTGSGSTGSTNASDFGTMQNTKSGAVQAALQSLLGQTAGLPSNFASNPFVVRSNVKDQAQADRISGVGSQVATDTGSNRASLTDFITKYLNGDTAAKANTDQEAGAVGDWYGGDHSVQSALDQLSKAQHISDVAAAAHAAGIARASNAGLRMQTGDSSYADKQLMDTIAGIRTTEAAKKADRDRQNYLLVKQGQGANAGTRNALLDTYASRALTPINARTSLTNSELAQTGQLGALTGANTIYQVDSPEAQIARRMALVGDASRIDLGNNFYGLRKPYDPNISGLDPSLRRYGGGGTAPPISYGGGPPVITSPAAGGGMRPAPVGPPRSPAEEKYKSQAGVYPSDDPNYSPQLMAWANAWTTPQRYSNNPEGVPSSGQYLGDVLDTGNEGVT